MNVATVRPVLVVTAGSVAQITLQLAFQTLIARHFGTLSMVDAYEAAISLPLVLTAILGLPLGAILIPMASQCESDDGLDGAWGAVTRIGALSLVVTLGLALGLMAAAEPLLRLLYGRLGDSDVRQSAGLLHILAWLVPANVLTAFCQAAHNWRGRFAISAMAGVIGPAITLAIVAGRGAGLRIEDVAWAAVIGAAVNVAVQLPPLLPQIRTTAEPRTMRRAARLLGPLLLGGLYLRLDPVVDRSIGSAFQAGTVACLGHSARIVTATLAVAVGGLSVVTFPRMAKAATAGPTHLGNEISEAVRALVTIILPLIAAWAVFGPAIVRDLLERGQFTAADTTRVALFVRCSLGIVIGGSLGEIAARAFYAHHDMKTPTAIGMTFFTVALALKFGLSHMSGARGILLASSLASSGCAGFQMFVLSRRLGAPVLKGVLQRVFTASLASGLACLAGSASLHYEGRLPSVRGGLIGLGVYAAAMHWLIRRQQTGQASKSTSHAPKSSSEPSCTTTGSEGALAVADRSGPTDREAPT